MKRVIGVGSLFIVACAKTVAIQPTPPPTPDGGVQIAMVVDAAAPAPVVTPPPVPVLVEVPELVAEPLKPGGVAVSGVFVIEGAVMVADVTRVGRLNGDNVEWMKKRIPNERPGVGTNSIDDVYGTYPDAVSVMYSTSQGRAPGPTYFPISGKGIEQVVGGGGGGAWLEVMQVGPSTVLGTRSSLEGTHMITVRGPKVARNFIPAEGHCPASDTATRGYPDDGPMVAMGSMAATKAGTIVSIGTKCLAGDTAAEIWDKTTGKSQIVDLTPLWNKKALPYGFLRGAGEDELWVRGQEFEPLLHFIDGKFSLAPQPEVPIKSMFTSLSGQLYIYDGNQSIWRLDGEKWHIAARLAAPAPDWFRISVDPEGNFWGRPAQSAVKLRESKRVKVDETCQSWFVYLYAASYQNRPTYTYPTTRQALESFPGIDDVHLVEWSAGYRKYVGVSVGSKAQADALVLHVKAKMKDEDPRAICYAPPSPRVIDMRSPVEFK